MSGEFRHFALERDWEGVAWLRLDKDGSRTNTLSAELLTELAGAFAALETNPPTGLVFASAKPAGFIAGADMEEFERIESPAEARDLVERGWSLFEWLDRLPFPTLALIRGHCMGGGLELALACRYRIVVDDPATRLALPEVMLGIVPAWGGMKRLPELVGPGAALDMMLTGKSVSAARALRIGLADACVPPRVMENAARRTVMSGHARHRPPAFARLLAGPFKRIVAARARKQVATRARPEHYPAPYAILDIWARHGGNALAVPADSPASLDRLLASPTARNLIRVFWLRERLRRFGENDQDGDAGIRHVHVVGAGVMGGDIAALCAARGFSVTLQDTDMQRVAAAIGRSAGYFDHVFRDTPREAGFARDRLIPDRDGDGARRADLVIEAIVENLDVKRTLFAELVSRARPDAMLATNTSSLRLEDIASALPQPGRLLGIHFFNPVARMPLVEVVSGEQTDPALAQRAACFVNELDKLPLPVKSAPGFLVNAVLAPYLFEALRCVEEGIAPETVDEALLAFGMPVGPVELVDTVGLDVALAAGKALADQDANPPAKLVALVEAGHLGRKSGQGFYRWENGKAQKQEPAAAVPGLADRIIAPLLAAARRCVDDDVVADADLADAGIIFGTGFAPFTGGPLHFVAGRDNAGGAHESA